MSPLALYGYVFIYWHYVLRHAADGWPINADEPALLSLVVGACLATLVAAIGWLVSIGAEINRSRELKLNLPGGWGYLLVFVPFIGIIAWGLFAGRFARNINRAIGLTPMGRGLGILMAVLPPLSAFTMLYFQRRLNILDKNKMSFLID